MGNISTKIFIGASIAFGVIGLLIAITSSGPDHADTWWDQTLIRLLFTCIFIILPSFALSMASKYLK